MALITASEIDPIAISDINAAADIAYQRVALDERCSPDDVPHMARCMAVSALIMGGLEGMGYQGLVQPLIIPLGNVSLTHFYVRLTDKHDEVSIDGTWQQFLRREQLTPELPKVLVARGSSIIEAALSYGMSEKFSKIWHSDHWRLPRPTSTLNS